MLSHIYGLVSTHVMWPALAAKLRHPGMVHLAYASNQFAKVDATRLAAASRVEPIERNHLMWLSKVYHG